MLSCHQIIAIVVFVIVGIWLHAFVPDVEKSLKNIYVDQCCDERLCLLNCDCYMPLRNWLDLEMVKLYKSESFRTKKHEDYVLREVIMQINQ